MSKESRNNRIYDGWFIEEADKARLKDTLPPTFPREFYHHITREFRPQDSTFEAGRFRTIFVLGHVVCESLGVQAAVISEDPQGLAVSADISPKDYPHITLSARPDVAPKTSNGAMEQLTWKTFEPLDEPLEVSVVSGYLGKDGKVITEPEVHQE